MKTSVNMIHKLDCFDVIQRTKDGMFNATTLVAQWNAARGERKEIKKFFENENTKRFIDALIKEENLHPQNSAHLESRANQGIPTKAFITTRGHNGATWMHPILFIKFAMWLNPAFEVKVLKFVYDELIKDRHLAGDNYRLLSASISKFPDVNYPEVARALNWIIFNKHYPEIRNNATVDQIKELHELERQVACMVDIDLITSYTHLIQVLRDIYNKRHPRF